jgi:Tfp pilus assembly protein PilX
VIGRVRKEERGTAMVIALILLSVMLALGAATIAFGGGQRRLAFGERVRESMFTLAEATLNAELFVVSQATWPGSAATALPAGCNSTTAATNCPDPTTVNAQFTGTDYSGYSWTTAVQDNGGGNPDYYSTAVAATQPSYDANGDGKIWVRAQAQKGTVKRTIVTQVKAQLQTIPFPRNTVTAGYFAASPPNAKKVMVDTNGGSYSTTPTQPGVLAVRCSSPPTSSCLNYDASKGQVSPPAYKTGYSSSSVLTSDQLNQVRGMAKSNGTYYASGCPSTLTGAIVFIENGNCSYNGGTYNSLASPGAVIIGTGTMSLSGNSTYYGLIYAANLQASTGYVVSTSGCAKIIGAVAVDGQGGVSAGNCGGNIAFNPYITSLLRGYADAAPVKSMWREVRG